MHVALIEHEAALAYRIRMSLAAEEIRVDPCEDHGAMPWGDCEVILLGAIDPVAKLRWLRRLKCHVPILVTTKGAIEDIVASLANGADDHLPRPFDMRELVARLRALSRRRHLQALIVLDDLVIDMSARTVTVAGAAVRLSARQWTLLEFLGQRQGHVVSREAILKRLYDGRHDGEPRIVDVFMHKLRKRLSEPHRGHIATIWGRGFMLRHAA